MLPFGLAASRSWTTLVSAFVTAIALSVMAYAVFGAATWQAFLSDATLAQATLEQNFVGNEKMQSVFAAVRLLGGSLGAAYTLHVAVATTIGLLMIHLCRSVPMRDGGGAAMATAALLASPFVLGYDLLLLAIPLLWIVCEAGRTGFLPWEKPVLAAAFMLPLLSTPVADRLHLPLAPPVLLALFAFAFRRAISCHRASDLPAAAGHGQSWPNPLSLRGAPVSFSAGRPAAEL